MPFEIANKEDELKIIQELVASDSKLAQEAEYFDQQYEFRKKMVLLRKQNNLTQLDIAEKTGMKQTAISRLEKDVNTNPTLGSLIKYLGVMNLQLDIVPKRETSKILK